MAGILDEALLDLHQYVTAGNLARSAHCCSLAKLPDRHGLGGHRALERKGRTKGIGPLDAAINTIRLAGCQMLARAECQVAGHESRMHLAVNAPAVVSEARHRVSESRRSEV